MKFDANLAWKEALGAISSNRDTLLALGGVFFLLPTLAYAVFFPMPVLPAEITPEAGWAVFREHFVKTWPVWLAIAVLQAIGTLAALEMLTGNGRPTVGEAIKRGAGNLLPYIVAQFLFGAVIGLAGSVGVALGGLIGSTAIASVAMIAAVAFAVYGIVRTGLVAPVITVEGQRNPVQALKRSIALTRGKFWPLLGFALLIAVAAFVITQLVAMVFGLLFGLVGGPEIGRFGNVLASSALGAALSVMTAALIAVVHRQLGGANAGSAPHG